VVSISFCVTDRHFPVASAVLIVDDEPTTRAVYTGKCQRACAHVTRHDHFLFHRRALPLIDACVQLEALSRDHSHTKITALVMSVKIPRLGIRTGKIGSKKTRFLGF